MLKKLIEKKIPHFRKRFTLNIFFSTSNLLNHSFSSKILKKSSFEIFHRNLGIGQENKNLFEEILRRA